MGENYKYIKTESMKTRRKYDLDNRQMAAL